jgi:integrase
VPLRVWEFESPFGHVKKSAIGGSKRTFFMSDPSGDTETRQILNDILGDKYRIILLPGYSFPSEPALLHKAKAGWYVDYRVYSVKQKKLVRKKCRVSGASNQIKLGIAKTIISEINFLLANGGHIDPIKELRKHQIAPIVVALDDFMKEKRRTLKRQSVVTYEKWCRCFLAFLEDKDLLDMDIKDFNNELASDLRQYALEELKLSNKPYNVFKGYVSGFFNYSKPIYKLPENPIAETLHNLPTKTSKHIYYNKAQIAEYKEKCEKLGFPDLWHFVCFIYYTFCRPWEEVRKMKIGDIKEKHIVIYAETSKTNHRTTMIPTALEKTIQEMGLDNYPSHYFVFSHGKPGEKQVGQSYFYERHIKVLKEMGLVKKGYDIYGWKHTGAIALYVATKDLMLVKEQCGHSEITQTVQYLRDLGVFHYSTEINKFPEI